MSKPGFPALPPKLYFPIYQAKPGEPWTFTGQSMISATGDFEVIAHVVENDGAAYVELDTTLDDALAKSEAALNLMTKERDAYRRVAANLVVYYVRDFMTSLARKQGFATTDDINAHISEQGRTGLRDDIHPDWLRHAATLAGLSESSTTSETGRE
jgi:hypothetical protein